MKICKPVLASKQFGSEDLLSGLVVDACLGTMSDKGQPSVNTDSVRVAKIMGGGIRQSTVMAGMVCMRGTEGTIRHAENAPISVFACGVEASATEAKGTVLMKNADDLMNYNKSEEKKMDEIIKSVAEVSEQKKSELTERSDDL